MKSFLKCKSFLFPRFHSKLNINRLSTLNANNIAVIHEINKDASPSEAKVSTLFVPGRHGGTVYQIVKPIIDSNYIEKNAMNIERSSKARGIELDVHHLLKIMNEWIIKKEKHQNASDKFLELEEESNRFKELNFIEEANALRKQSTECLEEIKLAKKELYDIEDLVMPLLAKIPNTLDPLTPLLNDSVAVHVEPSKNNSISLSHTEIGERLSLLEFVHVSPTAYFLKSSLAELEMLAQNYFSDKLQEMQFAPMSCVDFVKSFILEATGLDPYSCDQCIPLKNNKASFKVIQNLNLVGGATFQSLCAYLINMNTSVETLPAKYYSIGRHYESGNRNSKKPSLFSVVQSSSIHSLVLEEPTNETTEFDSMLQVLLTCYSHFKIPFRTVVVAAPRLNCTESCRVQIELWSPAMLCYVPVAYVSRHNDFVSKRLHISYGVQHNINGYCAIVEGTVVNVPVLLGCLIENYANKNGDVNFEKLYELFDQ
ncbi:serine--tRNA synthetase-like protein Slimp [Parasteatoda tepidariorum]|uniref:serine--tRNA synthetase-like protein Slimp n=1 Tax=Parasteatoda tepidariorum TaxID=114398 RepID=UPI00077FC1A8|nr:serine--tRNA synthetase-like protein Slimp [Parasteatoda tepidariorum]